MQDEGDDQYYMWPHLTKPDFHTHQVVQVWIFITLSKIMQSVSNSHLLFYEDMKKLYENSGSVAWCDAKIQLIEVEELDVCGSLVLSNPATYTASLLEIEYIATLQSFCKF